jgi:hypothetical protein
MLVSIGLSSETGVLDASPDLVGIGTLLTERFGVDPRKW